MHHRLLISTRYLKADALKGKRFGVSAFIFAGAGIPFEGVCLESPDQFTEDRKSSIIPLEPETRAAFLKLPEGLRAAGATIWNARSFLYQLGTIKLVLRGAFDGTRIEPW